MYQLYSFAKELIISLVVLYWVKTEFCITKCLAVMWSCGTSTALTRIAYVLEYVVALRLMNERVQFRNTKFFQLAKNQISF